MTPLLWNLGWALVAAPLSMLVILGSKQDAGRIISEGGLRFWRWPRQDRMHIAILILHIKGLVRFALYDIYRPLQMLLAGDEHIRRAETAWLNGAFAATLSLISLMILSSFYDTIPKEDRRGWSWLTSPFYFR